VGKEADLTAVVVEHLRGHYEVREIHFGRDYVWCPECVVVECDCGERLHFTGSEERAVCGCGMEHTSVVRNELETRRMSGDGDAPWRKELRLKPEKSEYRDWIELNDLD
jgi:hypothetical protein